MRPVHRWGIAAVVTALVLLTPYAGRARPVHDSSVDTADLVASVRDSAAVPYSGTVAVDGHVGLPIADHFTDLADLFGGATRLRVWWRGADDWRVDRLLDTGEVDLFHQGHQTIEWDYERAEARVSVDPEIRLPRDSDLLPPDVARRAFDGVAATDVSRISPRRVAGVDAAGLRVSIEDPRSTIRRVDVWVDPETGVALDVDVYGEDSRLALSTAFTTYSANLPGATLTRFRPSPTIVVNPDRILDIADAANQFAFVPAPSALAGLPRTSGTSAAVYGTGLTRVLIVPLPSSEADDLALRLHESGARRVRGQPLLRVGPLGAVISREPEHFGVRWLVAGTVSDETLLDAAAQLADRTQRR